MSNPLFDALNLIFAPILSLNPVLSLFVFACIVSLIAVLPYRFLSDQTKINELKNQQKEKQTKIKEIQKTNPTEATKMTNELLIISRSMFKLTIKPLLVVLVLLYVFFPWLGEVFKTLVIPTPLGLIPASTPFLFGITIPGWILWYIIISIPLNQLFRKILGL